MRGTSADAFADPGRGPRPGRRRRARTRLGVADDLFGGRRRAAPRAEPAPDRAPTCRIGPRPRRTWSARSSASSARRCVARPRGREPRVVAGPPRGTSPTLSSTSAWSRSSAPRSSRPGRRARGRAVRRSAGWSTGNPELRDALSDPARSREDKRALLHGLLEGKVAAGDDPARGAGGHRHAPHGRGSRSRSYQKVAADHRNRLVADRARSPARSATRRPSGCREPWPASTAGRCTSTSWSTPL